MRFSGFNSLEEYFDKLHFRNLNDLYILINSLYYPNRINDLEERLEFSLFISKTNKLNLKFGLFKLYEHNLKTIISFFEKIGCKTNDLTNLFSLMSDFSPEFGFGMDYNEHGLRLKTYFLRLQDNPIFKKQIKTKISQVCKLIDLDSEHLTSLEKENCYLLGLDHYLSDRNNLKLYLRNLKVDFSEIYHQLENNVGSSEYFSSFSKIFSAEDFSDVSYSYKYSNNTNNLVGFSVFFEIKPNLNRKINKLLETNLSNRVTEFTGLIKTLEIDGCPINYSHIGLSFSLGPLKSEGICLYYSPNYGADKK